MTRIAKLGILGRGGLPLPASTHSLDRLLEHEPFVRRLASALVRDPAGAEDVAQETWLLAVGQAPAVIDSAKGWLARVARTCAWKQHRSGTRRRRREEAAARPERVPAVADQVERAEIQRRLAAALGRLPEPQRTAIVLRYQADLSLGQIASRTQVPLDTVKSRLRLGLGKLRKDLGADPRRSGGVAPGVLALLPASRASTRAASVARPTWGALSMAGTKKLGLVLVVVLLAAAGGLLLVDRERDDDPSRLVTDIEEEGLPSTGPTLHGTPANAGAANAHAPGDADEGNGAESGAVTSTGAGAAVGDPAANGPGATGPTSPPDVVTGMILDADGQPLTGTGLLWQGGQFTTAGQIPVGKDAQTSMPIGRDGRFRFESVEQGTWYVGVDLGDGVSRIFYVAQTTGGAERPEVSVKLGEVGISGTVWGADGMPVAGAVVRASSQLTDLIAQTTTGADGRYTIGRLHPGLTWVSFALAADLDDPATTFHRHIQVADEGWTIVNHGSGRGLARVVGRVVCPDGEAVRARGRVILARTDREGFLIMPYDAEGRFDQEVPEDVYRVHVWPPNGSALDASRPDALFTATAPRVETDFVLAGARVRGRVPADVAKGRHGNVWLHPIRDGEAPTPPGSPLHPARTVPWADDGSFVLYGIPPGRYTLSAAFTDGKAGPALASVPIEVGDRVSEVHQDVARQ
ncbi:MAG: sigma-70 family RNA polymerase sigma factor [Planctomycetota bacterium]